MDKVSIIIPAYNEEKRIGKTIYELSKFFDKLVDERKLEYELLIVINNTKDRTEDIVKRYKEKNRRIRYLHLVQGGKGFAVIEGFKDALKRNNSLIGFKDADSATSPEEFWKLIKNIKGAEGVIADRYTRGAKILPPPTLARLAAKRLYNFWVRSCLLLPFRDTQCGAKVFTRRSIERVLPSLRMSNFAFDVDLLYALRKKDIKIKSIPTVWTDQEYSTINFWHAGPFMAMAIVRLRILNSPFKRFIKIYDKMVEIISRK